ncbi:MAG: ATP-binding cassette domain-containing protein [Bacteroidetes bacterium]|nr:ATP-binding cassette domain-containing protein [Bacteroidota bacterium]
MSIIKVENISKKYIIRHEKDERYLLLRDKISNGVKNIFKKNTSSHKEDFWALKDISFTIEQGDRVGIIGRNGAGKSTLLKILSRITEPTSGRIEINGRLASLLEVGTGFHPELTGRENIYLNGSILGMSRAEIKSKFDEIVAFSEVEKFLDTPVKRYSSGMYVRLAFAVAAHLEPEILIVDEVLAVGDMAFQKKCLGKMQEATGQGRTVLFVSHNMETVQKLCNKGLMLNQGRIALFDSMDKVIDKYLQTNVSASFIDFEKPLNSAELKGYPTKFYITDINNKNIPEISMGQNWIAKVVFKINTNLENMVAAIGISTLFDFHLRTIWSEPQTLTPGIYEASFEIKDIHFTKGNYKITIGLSSNHVTFSYTKDIVNVVISEVTTLSSDKQIINTDSGIIINQAKVQIHKVG